jgi:hypothetical protein
MAGSRKDQNAEFSDAQLEAVLHFDAGKACASVRPDVDGGSGTLGQFAVTGNEIGMQVSFENVTDANTLFIGSFEVNIDIPLGIDHNGLSLRGQHVRRMRQATQVKLLEVHGVFLLPLGPAQIPDCVRE